MDELRKLIASLEIFDTLGPVERKMMLAKLKPAERKLWVECGTGEFVEIGDGELPETDDEAREIRGPILRFFCLGGGICARVHEKGVQLEGAWVTDVVDLQGCRMERDLGFGNCRFEKPIILRSASVGTLNLHGSVIPSLVADRLKTRGGVFLRDGFRAEGEVCLVGAKIGGSLDCDNGAFVNPGKWKRALNADSASVTGNLFFRDVREIRGALDLTKTSLGAIVDDRESWPDKGNLILDGCTYGPFPNELTDTESRLDWLALQDPTMWGGDFWPQPYEQLAKVLREMGHLEYARKVAIEKQRQLRKLGLIAWWVRPFHWLFGVTVGYGYRPALALLWLAAFVTAGALWFGHVYETGAVVPNNAVVLRSDEWVNCQTLSAFGGVRAKNESITKCWLQTGAGRDYPRFQAGVYALDTFVPFVNLGQETAWTPQPERAADIWGKGARLYLWLHILSGWALTALAVAGFTGLVKKD